MPPLGLSKPRLFNPQHGRSNTSSVSFRIDRIKERSQKQTRFGKFINKMRSSSPKLETWTLLWLSLTEGVNWILALSGPQCSHRQNGTISFSWMWGGFQESGIYSVPSCWHQGSFGGLGLQILLGPRTFPYFLEPLFSHLWNIWPQSLLSPSSVAPVQQWIFLFV